MKNHIKAWLLATFILIAIPAKAELRFITTEEPPTNYIENGKLVGITTDIVVELQKRLNINAPIDVIPWARAYRIAKTQPNVLVFTAGKSPERVAHGFHFIGPISTRTHILVSRKDATFSIEQLNDIKNLKLNIGAMRGDWREKYFVDRGFVVQNATNHYIVLKMLAAGRIPLAISSDLELPALITASNLDTDLFKPAYKFKTSDSYILLSKGTRKETVKKWHDAFKHLQLSDFFDKTAAKWGKKLGVNLVYLKESGFIVKDKKRR